MDLTVPAFRREIGSDMQVCRLVAASQCLGNNPDAPVKPLNLPVVVRSEVDGTSGGCFCDLRGSVAGNRTSHDGAWSAIRSGKVWLNQFLARLCGCPQRFERRTEPGMQEPHGRSRVPGFFFVPLDCLDQLVIHLEPRKEALPRDTVLNLGEGKKAGPDQPGKHVTSRPALADVRTFAVGRP